MLKNRKFWIVLPALAFSALLLAGLVVSVISLKEVSTEDWVELKNSAKILSGESTRRFTKLLNQHFVLGPSFNQIERGTLWNLTGDLGSSVRAGCNDWLFLTDELEIYPDRVQSAQFRAELVTKLNAKLRERDIKLLVVVVPDKARIERSHLCGIRRSNLLELRVENWLERITVQGVEALNLTNTLSVMPSERYYRTDTHWNEAGANASAKAIAEKLAVQKWISLPSSNELAMNSQRAERSGDLVHLAGLDDLPVFLRPALESVQITIVPRVVVASGDLFGDAGLPSVALVGTSYSRNSNFVPFMEHYLGEMVVNLAKDGGDFAGSAASYFSSHTFSDYPPKIIIWEIPERVIEKPINDAERNWMKTLLKHHAN